MTGMVGVVVAVVGNEDDKKKRFLSLHYYKIYKEKVDITGHP